MATASEPGYCENPKCKFDYYEAGFRCIDYTREDANEFFDALAREHGVRVGPNGSWDQFWMGHAGENISEFQGA
jgi:hypothetical protein